MTTRLNRRAFTKSVLAGLGAAATASLAGAQSRKLKIGCTALIWGALPRSPENLAIAVRDMASLGFHGFETFASIISDMDGKGTLAPLIEQHKIPLISGYATVQLIDTSTRKENLAQLIQWGTAVRKNGGRFMVLAPNSVKREAYSFAEHRNTIVAGLNDYAKAMNDIGLGAGLHQHTSTAVESRDETYAVMEAVDTRHLKFAPDVGQLQKGGADAAKVVKDFASITVHMHLKDYRGWEHFAGYCPLGQGTVDLKSILDTMEAANPNANIMHELDGSPNAPYTPLETAKIAVGYLQRLGYSFRT
ncbi:MAG TPA: sugar phosphate isomerase/epimerase [Vicinamibacterales bacterium]|nr:sugar phosphate isomerase/epimerase [Vicinamibacterales bacterium]